jgi:hypothetical protein
MQFVTPEEIAHDVVREILGGNTGRDVIGALDGSVMGPTFRAGYLREAALERLRQLGEEHGESVAFEILGPPRMSKLLYETFLLKQAYANKISAALKDQPKQMAEKLEGLITKDAKIRQQIISIGLPILLADGKRILRGPIVKSEDAEHGWVDLTAENMARWSKRLQGIQAMIDTESHGESSSLYNRGYPSLRQWVLDDRFEIGEMVAWISINEDEGLRGKD